MNNNCCGPDPCCDDEIRCSICGNPMHSCCCDRDFKPHCPPQPKPECCDPCAPHAPRPLCGPPPGCSPYDRDKQLQHQINELARRMEMNDKSVCAMLNKYKAAAVFNGAYYTDKEVHREGGYDANSQSTYEVIRIHAKDSACQPIKMQLRLAYENTTNSQLQESLFQASEQEFADKMVTAIDLHPGGWFGNTIWRGAQIPSKDEPDLYTVGFSSCNNKMLWYKNTEPYSRMRQDKIENAMGVYGILVNKGEVTNAAMRIRIPQYAEQTARVGMGQNYTTGETIIITCGNTDTHGMTSETLANLFVQYGCDVAVELTQSASAGATDKGALVFTPEENKVPKAYAFWYISKKCFFRDQITHDIAWLVQKYGQFQWTLQLIQNEIVDIKDDIERIYDELAEHSARLDMLESRVSALEQRVASLEARMTAAEAAITQLQADLAQEIQDRITGDAALQAQIDIINQQITEIEAHLTVIDGRLDGHDAAIAALQATVAQLRADLDALDAREMAHFNSLSILIAQLRTDVNNLQIELADLQSQVAAIDAVVVNILSAINSIEIALNELKQWRLEIDNWRITVDNTLNDHEERITELENRPFIAKSFIATMPVRPEDGGDYTPAPFITLTSELDNYTTLRTSFSLYRDVNTLLLKGMASFQDMGMNHLPYYGRLNVYILLKNKTPLTPIVNRATDSTYEAGTSFDSIYNPSQRLSKPANLSTSIDYITNIDNVPAQIRNYASVGDTLITIAGENAHADGITDTVNVSFTGTTVAAYDVSNDVGDGEYVDSASEAAGVYTNHEPSPVYYCSYTPNTTAFAWGSLG